MNALDIGVSASLLHTRFLTQHPVIQWKGKCLPAIAHRSGVTLLLRFKSIIFETLNHRHTKYDLYTRLLYTQPDPIKLVEIRQSCHLELRYWSPDSILGTSSIPSIVSVGYNLWGRNR
jgi:hypothetical protein